jgi:hypothetical protein
LAKIIAIYDVGGYAYFVFIRADRHLEQASGYSDAGKPQPLFKGWDLSFTVRFHVS